MSDIKTIKLLGGPNKNKIVEVPISENCLVVNIFDRNQLMMEFYNGDSIDKFSDHIKEFRYVDSTIKDERFNYFIPEGKNWFDYKKLRDIYYSQTPY